MSKAYLTIKWHNVYGNIGAGVCLLALGVALIFDESGIAPLLCAVALLAVAGVSLIASLSAKHEAADEMAVADDGTAASFAFKALLIALGIACCVGLVTGMEVRLSVLTCISIGFAQVLYGVRFAWLERN